MAFRVVSRIREIQDQFLHPPSPQEKPTEVHPVFLSEETPVSGIPPSAGPSGEIRFIMTDELAEAEAEAVAVAEVEELVDLLASPEQEYVVVTE